MRTLNRNPGESAEKYLERVRADTSAADLAQMWECRYIAERDLKDGQMENAERVPLLCHPRGCYALIPKRGIDESVMDHSRRCVVVEVT